MSGDPIRDTITAILLVVGSLMSLAAGIGLMRFRDTLSRMHAGAKPQIFGVLCMVVAVAVQQPTFDAITTVLLIVLFQMLTQPISAHMVGRAAYRTEHLRRDLLLVDELADDVARAERERLAAEREEQAQKNDAQAEVEGTPRTKDARAE